MRAIQVLDFEEHTRSINCYIPKRMQINNIFEVMNMERPDFSPAVYSLPQHSPSTTASGESSFSMLQKLLAKDRNCENVKQYMILYFSSCT